MYLLNFTGNDPPDSVAVVPLAPKTRSIWVLKGALEAPESYNVIFGKLRVKRLSLHLFQFRYKIERLQMYVTNLWK